MSVKRGEGGEKRREGGRAYLGSGIRRSEKELFKRIDGHKLPRPEEGFGLQTKGQGLLFRGDLGREGGREGKREGGRGRKRVPLE
jgi:hypothetical protein